MKKAEEIWNQHFERLLDHPAVSAAAIRPVSPVRPNARRRSPPRQEQGRQKEEIAVRTSRQFCQRNFALSLHLVQTKA